LRKHHKFKKKRLDSRSVIGSEDWKMGLKEEMYDEVGDRVGEMNNY
jgi:hypothetical protein